MFVLIAAHRGAVIAGGLSKTFCEVSFTERLKLLSETAKVLLKYTTVTERDPKIH